MACRLAGAEPLLEPTLAYCQLDYQEQIVVKFEYKCNTFHLGKWIKNVICKMVAILLFGPRRVTKKKNGID